MTRGAQAPFFVVLFGVNFIRLRERAAVWHFPLYLWWFAGPVMITTNHVSSMGVVIAVNIQLISSNGNQQASRGSCCLAGVFLCAHMNPNIEL